MSSSDSARKTFVEWLRMRSAEVKECERKAGVALYEDNDEVRYRDLMCQKASLLASMAEDADPLLSALSGREKSLARERLESFSASAKTALRLHSVFYMSALLYPDDHKAGEPDDLENFIASLA